MASTGSDPTSAIQAGIDALGLLELETDHADIQGFSLNQELDEAGELVDTVELYWSLFGRPGFFTTRVPFDPNWTAIAFAYIGQKLALVRAIYDELPSKDAIPGGPIGPPLPGPGQAIAI